MDYSEEEHVIELLIERFERDRLPRLLDIHKRVLLGEILSDGDIAFLETVMRLKPSSSKGTYLKGMAISTTMGPGIKIDPALVKELVK